MQRESLKTKLKRIKTTFKGNFIIFWKPNAAAMLWSTTLRRLKGRGVYVLENHNAHVKRHNTVVEICQALQRSLHASWLTKHFDAN